MSRYVHIQDSSRLSVVSACFTIYAYESLKNPLIALEGIQMAWPLGGSG
jgi:hypothetical protein